MEFIIVQIIGVLAAALTVASTQSKSKDGSLVFIGVMDLFVILQYALLGAVPGLVATVVGLVRVLIFYLYDKEGKKIPWWVFGVACAAVCGMGAITYKRPIDLLPVAATLVFTYGIWQSRVSVLRITQFLAAMMLVGYDLDVSAYADLARVGLEAAFACIGYARYEFMGRHHHGWHRKEAEQEVRHVKEQPNEHTT
jgi:hypothetical protein